MKTCLIYLLLLSLVGCATIQKTIFKRKESSKTTKPVVVKSKYMIINQSKFDFGEVEIGSRKLDEISIINKTKKKMSINLSDNCFKAIRVNQSFCISIKPEASCRVEIEFQPVGQDLFDCVVQITNDQGDNESVEISGKGIK